MLRCRYRRRCRHRRRRRRSSFATPHHRGCGAPPPQFYAPWCGHCQQLKPTYKKLAAQFEAVESVTIAAMDATAGTPPDTFDVSGYPTIMFAPANDKAHPISYDGPRDVGSMTSWIKEHASVTINDEL
jgi:protein disulfide-isomerase-like protein